MEALLRKYIDQIDLVKEVNTYAEKNNLEIISISVYENKGIYVVFRQIEVTNKPTQF